jgi:hypothetical protein
MKQIPCGDDNKKSKSNGGRKVRAPAAEETQEQRQPT